MMNETDDRELLRRYAGTRDEAAFGELVRRHVNLVYGGALRRVGGDAHLAEDVTQQVFCDLARRARELTGHAVLGGWLYTSTRFAAAHVVRAEQRRRVREQAAFTMNASADEEGGGENWEKLRPVLDDTIDELEERDRAAVVLRYFEGRSFAEIGARLRLTENAARMRVERALDKLHGLLARRGITSTTAALGVALGGHAATVAPAALAGTVTSAALASGATIGTATAASAWATFMSMTKLQVGITGALAVAGATGFVTQAETAASLRAEAEALRRENTAIAALQAENLRLGRLAVEVADMRRDDAELARLEEEAGVLRTRLQQIARAEEARLAAARTKQVYEISMLDRTPVPRFQARPQYPFELRRAGVTGEVVVDFVVDADGTVKDARALRSTQEGFEAAAVEAVSKWRFAAGQKGGQQVATHLQVPIVFTLDKSAVQQAAPENDASERATKLREEAGQRKAAVEQALQRQQQRKAEKDGRGEGEVVTLQPFVTEAKSP